MKSKPIGLTLTLMILVLVVSLSNNSDLKIKSYEDIKDENLINNNELKSSAFSERIHIDNNWTAAKIAGICTGNGNYSDPYVIEDLVIDGHGSGICLSIENTNMRFMVLNCTFFSSGDSPVYNFVGILLTNVSNGQFINNNCLFNSYGIYLDDSSANNITGNNVANSHFGINIYNGELNTVSNNNVSNNDYGI